MRGRAWIIALTAFGLAATLPAQAGGRRALLIGINDYSASRLPRAERSAAPGRDVPSLDGTANDVAIMHDLLIALYGFRDEDIITLTDQRATRAAILHALGRRLLGSTEKSDVVLFYFSGHGSQVRNWLSDESDHLDESLVPADSRQGAADIRDKELRPLFNRILDRGARLTIVLDTCHSGSGARGPDDHLRIRAVQPDLRNVADRTTGRSPESRGALVLSAAQDFSEAFETLDERGKIRGAFSWALARALRDAEAGESAADTFLRVRARLQVERPAQDPVIACTAATCLRPFLGVRTDRRGQRPVIAVERAMGNGEFLLQGGWASGVTSGSELRLAGHDDVRLEVTSLLGTSRCKARGPRDSTRLKPGALLEIITWAAPPSPPLRIWIPRAPIDPLVAGRSLRQEATQRGIRWIEDPLSTTTTHLLRWRDGAWELLHDGGRTRPAMPLLSGVPPGASLFVQLPVALALAESVGGIAGVESSARSAEADYVLTGRLAGDRLEYSWVRPLAIGSGVTLSILPPRTDWTSAGDPGLRDGLVKLRRVQGWNELRSPMTAGSHYRLAIRRLSDGEFVEDGILVGKHRYRLVLRAREPAPAHPLYARYLYVFAIDSDGKSTLLFPPPETGAVENLLPSTTTPGEPLRDPPAEIELAGAPPFLVSEPYGLDTFFLLTTDEPLSSLTSLAWKGVRGTRASGVSRPLEELLAQMLAGTRSPDESVLTPPTWSIDRVTFQSIPPRSSTP
ncbi:MAG: caspase family protein [Acidobacteriota bacterium]